MQDRFRPKVREETETPSQFPPFRPENASLSRSQPGQAPGPQSANREAIDQEFEVEGVYIISVAARILDMHPQTLRKYERLGLINPARTVGMLRLYSQGDIRKILLIRLHEGPGQGN